MRAEALQQHGDQRRQIDPAFVRVEDRALRRDRPGVDSGRDGSDLIRLQELGRIGDIPLIGEDLGDAVVVVIRIPGQTAVEAKPRCVGMLGRQLAVSIEPGEAQAMILR
jgi:hypothetical protein